MYSSLILPSALVFLVLLAGCDQKKEAEISHDASISSASTVSYSSSQAVPQDQLNELLSPVALFPDRLLALVLAASTDADDVASANAWRMHNSSLKGQVLVQRVDAMTWPPAVKALVGFPDVLSQMAQNLPWTRALGNAFAASPSDIIVAVQMLRQRAEQSGALKNTSAQTVQKLPAMVPSAVQIPSPGTNQSITIQSTKDSVVYVPVYTNTVYGSPPVMLYPGYTPPACFSSVNVMTGLISFTAGVMTGHWMNTRWNWELWDMRWRGNIGVVYHHQTYLNPTIIVHNYHALPGAYQGPGPVRMPVFNTPRIISPVFEGRHDRALRGEMVYRTREPFVTHADVYRGRTHGTLLPVQSLSTEGHYQLKHPNVGRQLWPANRQALQGADLLASRPEKTGQPFHEMVARTHF